MKDALQTKFITISAVSIADRCGLCILTSVFTKPWYMILS